MKHHAIIATTLLAVWLAIPFHVRAEQEAIKDEGSHGSVAVRSLLEEAHAAGALPAGVVIRVRADLATAMPADAGLRSAAEARGVDFNKKLKELWEFTTSQVHRVVMEKASHKEVEESDYVYRRIESRPFDSTEICGELLDGKALEIAARKGRGREVMFAGTHFNIGGRSIEILRNGETILDLGEHCAVAGYAESDARAFGALYELLASQARAEFSPKVGAAQAPPKTAAQPRDPRLKWFDDAKYGLFINWGLYSIPAGEWKGKKYPNIGEWIMHDARIPVKEYEQLAAEFNPTRFNADEWVRLAVDAGMKYLVFDCKHHDGFALYRSSVSKYNCHDATPWKRDPMMELREACDRHGIKLCFYYSQATDWHEPNGANNNWDFPPNDQKDFDQYLRDKSLPQIKELLTQYGPIGLIWFDVPTLMTPDRSKRVADLVRSIQPGTLINSRLGPGGYHDYQSRGDNEIPHTVTPGVWETAATINDTWGYKNDDHNWKSPADICFKLVDITSKGGNYLLNVGPDAGGSIPQQSQDVLREIGAWLKVNGEAVYGAGRTVFGEELGAFDTERKDANNKPLFVERKAWRCTTKPGKLFLHFFQWPGASFELPNVDGKITKAYLLDGHRVLEIARSGTKTSLKLPATPTGGLATVVCLEITD